MLRLASYTATGVLQIGDRVGGKTAVSLRKRRPLACPASLSYTAVTITTGLQAYEAAELGWALATSLVLASKLQGNIVLYHLNVTDHHFGVRPVEYWAV